MTVRNILVVCNDPEGPSSALRFGGALAARDGGHLTGVLATAHYDDFARQKPWMPAEVHALIDRAKSDAKTKIEAHFRAFTATLGFDDRVHFVHAEGRVDAVAAQIARGYDIVLLDQKADEAEDWHLLVHPDQIALRSGRPIMVVPRETPASAAFAAAAIAWDGRRAAARALADTLDLLTDGATVHVLTVGDCDPPRPTAEIATHIERRGFRPVVARRETPRGEAQAILGYCRDVQADVLAMGAYEHSKFRTDIFGSLSAAIIAAGALPVILSH